MIMGVRVLDGRHRAPRVFSYVYRRAPSSSGTAVYDGHRRATAGPFIRIVTGMPASISSAYEFNAGAIALASPYHRRPANINVAG